MSIVEEHHFMFHDAWLYEFAAIGIDEVVNISFTIDGDANYLARATSSLRQGIKPDAVTESEFRFNRYRVHITTQSG
jgi:hypothetical protein